MRICALPAIGLVAAIFSMPAIADDAVRVKDLGRFLGWRDNALVGSPR
jgi:hypothetical protein